MDIRQWGSSRHLHELLEPEAAVQPTGRDSWDSGLFISPSLIGIKLTWDFVGFKAYSVTI